MFTDFRGRLLNGDRLIGTMLTLNSPEVAEILSSVGFDWLFIDAEHSTYQAGDIQHLLQGAGRSMPCLVRLAASDELSIKKALDVGAAGIIAPRVNTADHAREIVRFAKYAPDGFRGVGIGRAHGYGLSFSEYIARANDAVTVVVQAEHIDAVKNIDSIVAIPGIDAVLVGPYDLSASMGFIGQVDHPEVVRAIETVTNACKGAGVRLGIFGVSEASVQPYVKKGYTLIVAGVDTLMLASSAGSILKNLKE